MSAATHGVAAVVGAVLVMAIGVVSQPRGEGSVTDGKACPRQSPVVECPPARPPVVSTCPDERALEPRMGASNGRAFILEVQKARAEAALGELGGMPLMWDAVSNVPEGLKPEQFERLVARLASELGLAEPDTDCSEFPCVVIAPAEWTDEELAAVREHVRSDVGVEGAKLFVLDQEGRVFGVYSEEGQTSELHQRIWYRLMESRRAGMVGEG